MAAASGKHPPIPTDTDAYRRAHREKLCAQNSLYAYDDPPRSKKCYEPFCYPPGADGKRAELSAFAYLDGGTGYISFRGTFNLRNWLSDFHLTPKGRPRRHRGFDNCWRRLRAQVESWLARHKPSELILTGHSLGGAIAQLAALDLAPFWPIRAVVCFGAPLVGWRRYASAYNATPISERPGETLGAITTTYVFKSDLVRFLVLPHLGYKLTGQALTIDEAGRTGKFDPWFQAALGETLDAVEKVKKKTGDYLGYPSVTVSSPPFYVASRNRTQPPHVLVRDVIQTARPLITQLLIAFPRLLAALAAVGLVLAGLYTAVLSAIFFRRDISYHDARGRYLTAMKARFMRWRPLIYNEHGEDLLLAKNPADAVPYFTAALDFAEDDLAAQVSWSSPRLRPQLRRQHTTRYQLNRAEALKAIGDYPASIADLTAVIESYGTEKIEIPVDVDGSFSVSSQVVATQRRAIAFELSKQLPQAIADYTAILGVKPDDSLDSLLAISEKARRRVGAANIFATLCGYRNAEVDAEKARLRGVRQQVFNAGMAKTFEWAHYRRGLCALDLKDYAKAVADATAALTFNSSDAWFYNLRGAANDGLKNHEDALADFTRSIELEPDVAELYTSRGVAKQAKGDSDGAIADLTKAIELKPDVAEPYSNRGVSKQDKGDSEGAIADCTKAIELKPDVCRGLLQSRRCEASQRRLGRGHCRPHQSHRTQTGFCGGLLQSRRCEAGQRRLGRGHRGLHQSHRTQTGCCRGLLQSRRCEESQRRLGRRHRRLHQSHRTQTGFCGRPTPIVALRSKPKATWTAPSRTTPKPSNSNRIMQRPTPIAALRSKPKATRMAPSRTTPKPSNSNRIMQWPTTIAALRSEPKATRTGPSRTAPKPSNSNRILRRPTTIAALRSKPKATRTAPSRTTPKPSNSNRMMPRPTTIAALRSEPKAIRMAPSRTTPKPSNSNRIMRRPTPIAALRSKTKATWTGQLPTSPKPSNSNRILRRPTTIVALRSKPKATWTAPSRTAPKPSNSNRILRRPTTIAALRRKPKATRTAPSRTTPKPSNSNRILRRPTTIAALRSKKGDLDGAIADYTNASGISSGGWNLYSPPTAPIKIDNGRCAM